MLDSDIDYITFFFIVIEICGRLFSFPPRLLWSFQMGATTFNRRTIRIKTLSIIGLIAALSMRYLKSVTFLLWCWMSLLSRFMGSVVILYVSILIILILSIIKQSTIILNIIIFNINILHFITPSGFNHNCHYTYHNNPKLNDTAC